MRPSWARWFCPIFGILFTDYNRCLQRQIWKSTQLEWITCGPYDGHIDITKVKDAFCNYANMPGVNKIDSVQLAWMAPVNNVAGTGKWVIVTGNLTEILWSELLQEHDVCNYPLKLPPRIPSSWVQSHGKENRFLSRSDVTVSLTRSAIFTCWRRYGQFHIKSCSVFSIFACSLIPCSLSVLWEPNGKVYDHPPETWNRESGQQESDIYMWSVAQATRLGGRYFLPMRTGVSKVLSHMISRAATGTNHKMATALCAGFASSSLT